MLLLISTHAMFPENDLPLEPVYWKSSHLKYNFYYMYHDNIYGWIKIGRKCKIHPYKNDNI